MIIDSDKLMAWLERRRRDVTGGEYAHYSYRDALEVAMDEVEEYAGTQERECGACRCRECAHVDDPESTYMHCMRLGYAAIQVEPDGYCKWGYKAMK